MKSRKSQQRRSLCAARVLVPGEQGGYQIRAARLECEGSLLKTVELFSPEEYAHKVALWQKYDAQLEIFDARYLLTPAFINAHTHLAMNCFRGIDLAPSGVKHNMVENLFFACEARLSAADVRAFTRMGAYESLLAGVGFVWDHYYHGQAIGEALADTGLSGVVAPTLQDLRGPGKAQWEAQWQATEDINRGTKFREQGIFAAFGPHATDTVSKELWQKVSTACAKLELPLHAHLAQSCEEWQRAKTLHSASPSEYLERIGVLSSNGAHQLFAHGIFADRQDLRLLHRGKQTLVFCPFSAMIFAFPANLMAWEAEKVRWVVGSDCAASNDSMNLQKELRAVSGFPLQQLSYAKYYQQYLEGQASSPLPLAAERHKIWEDSTKFREADWLLAKVWDLPGELHPQVKVGKLSPGYLANLVVWDSHAPAFWPGDKLRSLAFGDTAASIHGMMVAGQWLGTSGNFAASLLESAEYKAAEAEARERLHALLAP